MSNISKIKGKWIFKDDIILNGEFISSAPTELPNNILNVISNEQIITKIYSQNNNNNIIIYYVIDNSDIQVYDSTNKWSNEKYKILDFSDSGNQTEETFYNWLLLNTETKGYKDGRIIDIDDVTLYPHTKVELLKNKDGSSVAENATFGQVLAKTENGFGFIDQTGGSGVEVTLYEELGQNVDGAVTQKVTTDELNKKIEFNEDEELNGEVPQTNLPTLTFMKDGEEIGSYNGSQSIIIDVTGREDTKTYVNSINGKTGDVNLFIPTKTEDLKNDSGFITEKEVKVKSVNGLTGEVKNLVDCFNEQTISGKKTFTTEIAAEGGITTPSITLNGENISDLIARKDFPTFTKSAYNCNICYDNGIYPINNGTNAPDNNKYGILLVFNFEQTTGNTQQNYAAQIFITNGSSTLTKNFYFRTSTANSWNSWVELSRLNETNKFTAEQIFNGGIASLDNATNLTSGIITGRIKTNQEIVGSIIMPFNDITENTTTKQSDEKDKIKFQRITSIEDNQITGIQDIGELSYTEEEGSIFQVNIIKEGQTELKDKYASIVALDNKIEADNMDGISIDTKVSVGDNIIETWTAPDKQSFYRKYASNWVEQGGISTITEGGTKEITLPCKMNDIYYIATITNASGKTSGNAEGVMTVGTKTTTTVTFTCGYIDPNTSTFNWYIVGRGV